MTTSAELAFRTTAIGSLPHHNVDAALDYSFRLDIPFLPQIPIRNPWEFMIAQSLEGLPGLLVEKDGSTILDLDVWSGRSRAFNERLLSAFSSAAAPDAFTPFEPSPASSSCWQPYLWEIEERRTPWAKLQLAGPLTSQWTLRVNDGTPAHRHSDLATQIFRLVLARAIGMARRLLSGGAKVLFFLDEPAFFAFVRANPNHAVALRELTILVEALRKEGVVTGIHCCSDTDWDAVLGTGIDVLSIDCGQSLRALLGRTAALTRFHGRGGRLSLGAIPTDPHPESRSGSGAPMGARERLMDLVGAFETHWKGDARHAREMLEGAVLTPACGLAMHSPSEAEDILEELRELRAVAIGTLQREPRGSTF